MTKGSDIKSRKREYSVDTKKKTEHVPLRSYLYITYLFTYFYFPEYRYLLPLLLSPNTTCDMTVNYKCNV